jgi:hypothetical protein
MRELHAHVGWVAQSTLMSLDSPFGLTAACGHCLGRFGAWRLFWIMEILQNSGVVQEPDSNISGASSYRAGRPQSSWWALVGRGRGSSGQRFPPACKPHQRHPSHFDGRGTWRMFPISFTPHTHTHTTTPQPNSIPLRITVPKSRRLHHALPPEDPELHPTNLCRCVVSALLRPAAFKAALSQASLADGRRQKFSSASFRLSAGDSFPYLFAMVSSLSSATLSLDSR